MTHTRTGASEEGNQKPEDFAERAREDWKRQLTCVQKDTKQVAREKGCCRRSARGIQKVTKVVPKELLEIDEMPESNRHDRSYDSP